MPRRRIPDTQDGLTTLADQATAHLDANQSTLNYDDKTALDAARTERVEALKDIATANSVMDTANRRLLNANTSLRTELGEYDDFLQKHAPDHIVPSGFPPLDTTLTPASDILPIPGLRLEPAGRRAIKAHFFNPETPGSTAKPDNAHHLQFYVKIGVAPASLDEMRELDVPGTRTPQTIEFSDAQIGQTVYLRARWVGNKGQRGPWSEVVSLTVAG